VKPLYVTTPIYYVNDRPHIGTAYSTIAADVITRYARLRGRPTRFLTGLDEHGLKLDRVAQAAGMTPQAFVDSMAPAFREAWELLACEHDDFIRTTEPRHIERAQALWRRVAAKGDIYLGHYEDWYCVGCETFYTEKELLEGRVCPQHKQPVERIQEPSYFFRLGAYTDRLLAFYEAHPEFVRPEGRYNEVKSFVREGLRDLSVSRTSFRWGVPVPGDPEHVMYVWFDALANYTSALEGPSEGAEAPLFARFWPPGGEAIHVVGKDILRFHAIYWPAFLLSAGLEPPSQVWAHGWLTVNGEKMSKSLGNFLAPGPLVEAFGTDVLRYYLMRDVAFGQDGDFSHTALLARYHGELGNGLGNLLNRMVASIVRQSFDGRVPVPGAPETDTAEDRELRESAARTARTAADHMDRIAPQRALDAIWELVGAANKYVDRTEPWRLAKEGDLARLGQVVYTVLEALRWLGVMIWPFMPSKAAELRRQLGLPPLLPSEDLDRWPSAWGGLEPGTATRPGAPLFPRFDEPQERAILERLGVTPAPVPGAAVAAKTKTKTKTTTKEKEPSMTEPSPTSTPDGVATVEYGDFAKLDLRVGLVKTAERVPKSDKLLRLEIELGEPTPRQVLAGIAEHFAPEALVGSRVAVVANLKPRKMMGLMSQGMVLAAHSGGRLMLVSVGGDAEPGSKIS
jgi:methionyl-tRNA synthetase